MLRSSVQRVNSHECKMHSHTAGGEMAGLRSRWCFHVWDEERERKKDNISVSIWTSLLSYQECDGLNRQFWSKLLFKSSGMSWSWSRMRVRWSNRRINMVLAMMWVWDWTIVMRCELSLKGKLFIGQMISVPTSPVVIFATQSENCCEVGPALC